MIRSFTTQEESEFVDLLNRFCEMSEKRFNVKISRVLYEKNSQLDTLRFNQIYTFVGSVWFETEKSFKRKLFTRLTETMQNALLKEI
jgi:glucan phosphorylase